MSARFFARAGEEPSFDEHAVTRGALTIVGSGRIDEPRGASGLETILDAYERHGDACAANLIGDFAFAIWDASRRRLFAARDYLGVRPLYYAHLGASLLVARSIDDLLAVDGVPRDLDDAALAAFLIGETFVFPRNTTYAAIKRLEPAHTLTWQEGRVTVARYWSLPLDRPEDGHDALERFRGVFDLAVRDRLRGATTAAVMMSGGLDSTSIAVTAQSMLPSPLHAYTTSFAPMFIDDEAEWAGRVVRAAGLEHHVVTRDGTTLFGDELARRAEPLADPFAGGFVEVARDAARYTSTLFSGQGGDAVFYTSHGHFRGLLRRLRLFAFARDVAGYAARTHHLPPLNLRAWVKGWFGAQPWRAQFPPWIREEVVEQFGLREAFDAEPRIALHPTRPEAHRALLNPAWTRLFETWDPTETGVPVEVVYPYFDRRLVELLFTLPPMPWFGNKFLLREAMSGRLPEEVRLRPKTPLRADPLRIVMQRSLGELDETLEAAPELERFLDRKLLMQSLRGRERDGYTDMLAAVAICLAKWWVSKVPASGRKAAFVQ